MKTWIIASAAFLLASASPPAQPEFDLSQLTGEWIMEENGRWVRETWGMPTAKGIEGSGSSGTGTKAASSERLRIERDGAVTTLWVMLNGAKAEIPFTQVSTGNRQLMFENLKHDHPQRIIYSRDGGWLFAEIMMADGSKTEAFSYRPANPPRATSRKPVPDIKQVEDAVTFSSACIDSDGFTNCGMPMRTHIRNLICWPMANMAGYSEPYRNSPAAECSFEARELAVSRRKKQPNYPWQASWARLHFITAHNCTGKRCKREWHIPRH